MAEHFKLEIAPRAVRVTAFVGVSEDFADEYRQRLTNNHDKMCASAIFDDPEVGSALYEVLYGCDENVKEVEAAVIQKKEKENCKFHCHASKNSKYEKYNYNKRVKKRAADFRKLAYINFMSPNVKFVTLTFDQEIVPNCDVLSVCHAEFRKFVKRVQSKFSDFKYIAVFDRQKNGHWHYHMLCNFDESVLTEEIRKIWSYGHVNSTQIYSADELRKKIAYCIDNMTRCARNNWNDKSVNLQGEKGYLRSNGLHNNIVLRSWNESEAEQAYSIMHDMITSEFPWERPEIKHSHVEKQYDDSEVIISSYVSHKTFENMFQKPVVAKRRV